jgi:DNA-binding NarL/FixJ family response regulator
MRDGRFTPVIIIEDDHQLRSSFVHVLSASNEYKVCGEYTNVDQALKRINELDSLIILLDVHLKKDSGLDRINDIKRVNPFNKIVMLSNDSSAITITDAFKKGADGYLLKSDAALSLGYHLSLLDKHDHVMSPGSASAMVQFLKGLTGFSENSPEFLGALSSLTKAQKLVYEEMLTGKTYTQIGGTLGISKNTVAQHVQKIYRAFKVRTRAQLTSLLRSPGENN